MKNAIWIGRRQVRALVVLLALLPIIPTVVLIHTMWQNSEKDRVLAIAEMNEMYRYQLRLAVERYSTSPESGSLTDQDLVQFLTHVFGKELPMKIKSSGDHVIYQSDRPITQTGFGYQVTNGRFKGFDITIDSVTEIPIHIKSEHGNTIRQAIYYLLGTILMAGGVWYAVHRGLKVDEIRKDLITTISHEIKTPVSAIKVLAESLESGQLSGDDQIEYLQLISDENDRIEQLADRFLTFGRLEKGQFSIQKKDLSIDRVLNEVISRMSPRFTAREGDLRWIGEKDIAVLGDHSGLEILLTNLVENALKYGGSPPRAVISAEKNKTDAIITLSDNGSGIPTAERAAVFRSFYRSEGRLDDGQTGVGLGLAISLRIAKLMKGSLTLKSSSHPDYDGATFQLRLPLARKQVS